MFQNPYVLLGKWCRAAKGKEVAVPAVTAVVAVAAVAVDGCGGFGSCGGHGAHGRKPGEQNLRHEIKIKNVSASFEIVDPVPKTSKKTLCFSYLFSKTIENHCVFITF